MGTPGRLPAVPHGTVEPLDLYLGAADRRYFGSGYRRVNYELETSSLDDTVVGLARVSYSDRWSLDADGRMHRPHLSSIDALVLSIQALEQAHESLARELLQVFFASSVTLRAGSSPWAELDRVPVNLTVVRDTESIEVSGMVGNIRVAVHLSNSGEHPKLAGEGRSVYGGLFQTTRCRTTALSHVADGSLLGRHETSFGTPERACGLEAFSWPGPTLVDYLVTLAQMSQALVYSSAGLTRDTAGPLWMRTLRIDRPRTPNRALESNFASRAILRKDRLIDRGGRRLHDIEVLAQTTSEVRAKSTLAYVECEAS